MSELSVEALTTAAQAQTGLTDFGDDGLLEALSRFVDSANREANLTEAGRGILFHETTQYLTNRLYTEHCVARYPEILEEFIDRPVFITGLYRSGTTKLHRLLCYDHRWHYLKTWQTLFPAPMELENPSTLQRVDLTNEILQRMADDAAGSLEAHPMDAYQPEEEYLLMVQTLRTSRVVLNTPSHARWCEQQSAMPMYRNLKRALQLLQWENRREGNGVGRMLLKAPVHLENLPALVEVFPDARLLVTHRDPVKSVASNCLMLEHMHHMYSEPVDLARLGNEKLHTAALALERSLDARSQLPSSALMEVRFDDIARRPLELVPAVYRFLEEPLDRAGMERMRRGEEQLQSHKSGAAHRYGLAHYGLDENAVYDKARNYLAWAEATIGTLV